MVHLLFEPCAQPLTVYTVSTVRLCVTLAHATHSTHCVHPYPLYDHISLLVMCVYVCVYGRRPEVVKAK